MWEFVVFTYGSENNADCIGKDAQRRIPCGTPSTSWVLKGQFEVNNVYK